MLSGKRYIMLLSNLRTLGRSGLPVSPLALGTMTFANSGWGSSDDNSAAVFDAYIDAGGNFLDTADVYSGGKSEELTGKLIVQRKLRDKVVLATKFSFAGGNGRKNLHRAIDASLTRLGTDYVDLYWMHVWDAVTPPEEMLQAMGDLIRAGKIRYFGLSDCPAWYAARMATLAQAHNVPGPIALQLPYSLVERSIELEHIPAARELGLGITPWSPLAAGFLTGKYSRDASGAVSKAGGRLDSNNQPFRMFSERNWTILDVLREVATEAGHTPTEVALAWALAQPGVTSLIFGANSPQQFQGLQKALGITLSPAHRARLQEAGKPEGGKFYDLFSGPINRNIFSGLEVAGWLDQK